MPAPLPLTASQIVVQVGLFVFAAIAIAGGTLQFYLGQPHTSPRLDNVHRFMAGVYFSTGLICLWTAITIRQQDTLVYLLAFGVFLAGAAAFCRSQRSAFRSRRLCGLRISFQSSCFRSSSSSLSVYIPSFSMCLLRAPDGQGACVERR